MDKENRKLQKTHKGELVREETPEGLWDWEEEGENLRNNPYKTPPNNLTNKSRDYNVKD